MLPAFLIAGLLLQEKAAPGTIKARGTIKSVDVRLERAVLEIESFVDPRGYETNYAKPLLQSVSLGRVPIRSLKGEQLGALKDLKAGHAVHAEIRGAKPGEATVMRTETLWVDAEFRNPAKSPAASRGGSRSTSGRMVEYDGVCREPVLVPLVFPVLGRKAPRDNWLAARGANGERRHLGQDIMAPHMVPLIACFDGVVYTRNGGQGGHYRLTLVGDNGWSAEYMHVNNDRPGTDDGQGGEEYAFAPGIVSGRRVKAGQLLGWNGDSGNAETTGHHLHFELWNEGAVFNAHPSLAAAQQLEAPRVDLPIAEEKPSRGELRLDGFIRSYDAQRKVLTVGVVAETRPGKGTEPESKPAKKFAVLDKVEFRSLLEGETVSENDLAVGQQVVLFGPDAGEGKAMSARRIYTSVRERSVPEVIPPVIDPPPAVQGQPQPQNQAPGPLLDRVQPELAQKLTESVNAYRKRYSAAPLGLDARLGSIAMAHARALLQEKTLSAETKGKPFLAQAKDLGYTGSNVRVFVADDTDDPWEAVHKWLRQADARDSLLSPRFNLLGVGYVEDPSAPSKLGAKKVWCIVLGGP